MIPMLAGANPKAAAEKLRSIFHNLQAKWLAETGPIMADFLSGKISNEEAAEAFQDVAEDLEDEFLDHLADVADAFWDFSAYPGGPLGQLLEGLDGDFWDGLFSSVGSIVGPLARWVHDLLTLDELERARRVTKLQNRAQVLLAEATEMESEGRTGRAKPLGRRAQRKLDRAGRLVG